MPPRHWLSKVSSSFVASEKLTITKVFHLMSDADTSIDQHEYSNAKRSGMPAWAMSIVMHALAFLLLGLAVKNVAKSQVEDPGRPVSIVLAKESGGDSFEFVDGDSEESAESATAAAGGATASEEASLPPGELTEAADLFPDVALPGAAIVGGGNDETLKVGSLSVSPNTKILPGEGDAAFIAREAARRARSTGPQGPPASVSLFGSAPALGHSFVFVIDRSKSMGGRGLNALVAAEEELIASLAKLERNHKFEIVAYHSRPVYFSQKYFEKKQLVVASPENVARVEDFFGGLAPFGHTEHGMAVKTALYLRPDVIYLLTDGGDPPITERQIQGLKRISGGLTTIHCIQFGSGKKRRENFMERLASEMGGGYGYVDMTQKRPSF